ncbi:MAG: helix-turn-helix domain-containing protein [Castellaniella sp.]|nr:helix-turn-helix domain-containing protein [Castellaniella sp.]
MDNHNTQNQIVNTPHHPHQAVAPIKLMTAQEVMNSLKICRTTLYAWIRAGRLPNPTKFGEKVSRWNEADINRFAANGFKPDPSRPSPALDIQPQKEEPAAPSLH